jgi:hypothetical protein
MIETVALAEAVLCAELCAVTVTGLDGTDIGAVYKPDEVIVPLLVFPPLAPFTIQLTAVLLAPETEALNCCECPTCTLVLAGDTKTDTAGAGVMETVALADAVDCDVLCAVTVTGTAGTDCGAVYSPELEMVPAVESPPTTPFTSQLYPVKLVPEIVALNCWDCPTCTAALVGEIATDTVGGCVISTDAFADAEGAATLCAVTVMPLDGATPGAVYRPDEEIVPVAELPPTMLFTSQFTLLLLVPETEALNCCDCRTCKVEELGEIETVTVPVFV